MKKDKNAFIKILIILVIASLALLAIVYFMINNKNTSDNDLSKINISNINDENKEVDNNIMDENENIEEINNDFDSRGKLVVHQDIEVSDDHFFALCEGSDWQIGDAKEILYKNDDYNYEIEIAYTEFFNDDLIIFPYLLAENNKRLIFDPTVTREIAENYNYTCGPHGPTMGVTLTVEDAMSAAELKDETKPKFEEITIGEWDAVSYVTAGYVQLVHIVLLEDEHNYHFTIESESNKSELLDIIENNFVLFK